MDAVVFTAMDVERLHQCARTTAMAVIHLAAGGGRMNGSVEIAPGPSS